MIALYLAKLPKLVSLDLGYNNVINVRRGINVLITAIPMLKSLELLRIRWLLRVPQEDQNRIRSELLRACPSLKVGA